MKTQNSPGIARGLTVILLASVTVLFYGCKSVTRQLSPAENPPVYDLERPPVEAPASVKAADFRLSPPGVQDITVQKITPGKALVRVRFASDQRLGSQVVVTTDDGPVTLHDDGLDGDEQAGDGIYSAMVALDVDALVADQEATLRSLREVAKKGPLVVDQFHGRDIVGTDRLDLDTLETELHGNIIPFRFPPPGTSLVDAPRSLFVTDTNVVDDPSRTFDPCTRVGTPMGKWTFGWLMTQMANQPVTHVDPSDFTLAWLTNWLGNQTVNGSVVAARTNIQNILIDPWPKLANGKLDLSKAPMKLLAIVNRIDLAANSSYGPAGGAEGRFIFAPEFTSGETCGAVSNFNVILEYGVPASSCAAIRSWAQQWLDLQNFTLGSSNYNAGLEAITDQFTATGASPSKPNGNALDQLRTDELELGAAWELREFHLSASDNFLHEATIAQTPVRGTYDGALAPAPPAAVLLGDWINLNSTDVTSNTYTIPLDMPSPPAHFPLPRMPFLAAEVTNQIDFWNASNIITETNRHNVSLNTCNACHGAETGTGFTQVFATPSGAAGLSGFLLGINNVVVPVNGPPDPNGNPAYSYDDLERRAQVLWADAHSPCLLHIHVPVILMPE